MKEFQKHEAEQNKLDTHTRKFIVCESIYVKSKNRKR